MKSIALLYVALLFLGSTAASQQVKSFRDEQFRYPRVRLAAKEKDDALRRILEEKKIPPRAILFRAFEKEALLELWASENAENSYALVHLRNLRDIRRARAETKIWRCPGVEKDHRALRITVASDGRYNFGEERSAADAR